MIDPAQPGHAGKLTEIAITDKVLRNYPEKQIAFTVDDADKTCAVLQS